MKLPVFEGIVEALERHSAHRKRKLELAKTTPQKKRRVELKKKRVREAQEHILWSRQHGHDTYSGAQCDSEHSDIDVKVIQGEGGQKVSSRGKGRPQKKGRNSN